MFKKKNKKTKERSFSYGTAVSVGNYLYVTDTIDEGHNVTSGLIVDESGTMVPEFTKGSGIELKGTDGLIFQADKAIVAGSVIKAVESEGKAENKEKDKDKEDRFSSRVVYCVPADAIIFVVRDKKVIYYGDYVTVSYMTTSNYVCGGGVKMGFVVKSELTASSNERLKLNIKHGDMLQYVEKDTFFMSREMRGKDDIIIFFVPVGNIISVSPVKE